MILVLGRASPSLHNPLTFPYILVVFFSLFVFGFPKHLQKYKEIREEMQDWLLDNLRPISITHVAGKMLEKFVGDFID